MSPFVILALAPFIATDANLSWSFEGKTLKKAGRYDLVGKDLRGEVHWFLAEKGHYDAQVLYKSDTLRTKEADATKSFSHEAAAGAFAGMPAIVSDQRYLWQDAMVRSRCIYCAQGNRAWVVRLWWPRGSTAGEDAATSFLKSFRRLK